MADNSRLLELMRAWRDVSDGHGSGRELKRFGDVAKHVQERERQAKMDERRELDGLLIKLLRRLGGYYDGIETSDRAAVLERTYNYIQEQVRQARLAERSWQAALPDELETWITDVITRAVKEAAVHPDGQELIRENATTCLRTCTRLAVAERERQARLDEHKILAGLDEEGRKQRYLALANE